MTTTNITTCDSCKREICSVGYGRKSEPKFRTMRVAIYPEGSNYGVINTDFHICEHCYDKYKALSVNAFKQPEYKDNVYQLLNDLLVEMGVLFEE